VANRIISYASNVPLHDYGCTLRVYRREFLEDIPLYGEMHRFIPIYVTWAGARMVEMPVRHHPRVSGTSKYGLSRIFKVLLDMLTVKFLRDYFVNPLYFFGYFGFLLTFMGVGSLGGAVFMKWHYGTWMHKNPLIIFSVMFLIMALVVFMMGLIAEVLIRMSFEIQKKPPYKVQQYRNMGSMDHPAKPTNSIERE
jgi:dolichol-phosphate mannosyltransferase